MRDVEMCCTLHFNLLMKILHPQKIGYKKLTYKTAATWITHKNLLIISLSNSLKKEKNS